MQQRSGSGVLTKTFLDEARSSRSLRSEILKYRDHNYIGITQSLCPQCLTLVQAKIIVRDNRVYFRKHCPTHGTREDFVCSDARLFDRHEYTLPGKVPTLYGSDVGRGCPYDCGLCEEHEQHTCIGLLEITQHCNLNCPICFASSGPGGDHLTVQQCRSAIDRLVEVETQPEVLQLSGGEPTVHPQFDQILNYACDQPIDIVMVNTNGIKLATDDRLLDLLAGWKHRCEVYFQFDSLDDGEVEAIRGQSLVQLKRRAIERLGQAGIRTTLVCTLQSGVNENQIGPLAQFAAARPWITGLSFQPTTYTGRYFSPPNSNEPQDSNLDLESRITFPDVIHGLAQQRPNDWRSEDFSPLPCAHPNGHSLAYAYRKITGDTAELLPLARMIDFEKHLDLLAGRITFDRRRVKTLLEDFLNSTACGFSSNGFLSNGLSGASNGSRGLPGGIQEAVAGEHSLAAEFLNKALTETLAPEDMLRVTTTSFMDAYNFDVRQLMKSCVHQVLPSGHIIPFSAYNVLYRDGHVPLPRLRTGSSVGSSSVTASSVAGVGKSGLVEINRP